MGEGEFLKEIFAMKERHLKILNIINEKEKVSVQELSETLKLSMVTIRKDLEDLESQGLLRRLHGFAVKASPDSINSRMAFHYPEKKAIAQKAVELVQPMETIMIESGSTCALFALEAARQKDVTIITNSAYIARYLNQAPTAHVILLGGDYDTVAEVTTGPVTQLCAREYHVNKLFVGVDGYTEESGFTNSNHTRSCVVKELATRAEHVVVLTTSDKFGRQSVAKMFTPEEVQSVVTDSNLSEEYKRLLESHGIQVEITEA